MPAIESTWRHGDHQQVDRRLGGDVLEGRGSRRAEDDGRGDLVRGDAAEEAVGHAGRPSRCSPATPAATTGTISPGAPAPARQHEPGVVGAEARQGPVLVALLDQHLVAAAHARPAAGEAEAIGEVAQAPRALPELVGREAAGHGGGRRAGPRGVREDVHLAHRQILHHPGGAEKGGLVLAGEADDRVGGEVDAGQRLAGPQAGLHVRGGVVGAAHGPQDARVAGLQRDVQVGCDDRRLGDGGQEPVVHGPRLDRGDPQADEPADRAHGAHEVRQGGAGGRVAIGPDVDARQHQLGVPLAQPPAGVAEHPLERPALGRAAGGGDDAERAARVAPVLDLQEGPRAPGRAARRRRRHPGGRRPGCPRSPARRGRPSPAGWSPTARRTGRR